MADEGRELWAYSAQDSWSDHDAGVREVKLRNMRPRIWLVLSACPLVCGWNPDDRLGDAPIWRQNSLQNWEVNWDPLSDTMSEGRPWILNTWSTITWAVSRADGNLGRGIKWAAFEKRSTTVRMTVFPAESGRPVTKSNAMWDHGRDGMGRGLRRPAGGVLLDLVWAQTWQEATKRRTSRSLVGHQNRWRIAANVPRTPGCATNLDEWPQWRTAERTTSGTNNVPSGARGGLVTWERALLTACSTPQIAAPTTQRWGKILSLVEGPPDGPNWRERASGLRFLEPGLNEIENSKRPKKSAHRAWRALSLLAERMYSRFWWSVQTINGTLAPSSQCRHSPSARRIAKALCYRRRSCAQRAKGDVNRKRTDESCRQGKSVATR